MKEPVDSFSAFGVRSSALGQPLGRGQTPNAKRRTPNTKRPRVGIDAHALGSGLGGNETYIRNVIRALATVDPDGDYTLFLSPPLPQGPIAGAERMCRVMVRPHTPLVRIPVSFPLALEIGRAHV